MISGGPFITTPCQVINARRCLQLTVVKAEGRIRTAGAAPWSCVRWLLSKTIVRDGAGGGKWRGEEKKNHPAERDEGDSITLERNHSRREEERPTLHITLRINTRAIDRAEHDGGRR